MSNSSPLSVPGFTAAGIHCGIKPGDTRDLMLIASDRPAAAAGVFTRNLVRAAPVELTRQVVAGGPLRALVANSGNANAYTGDTGEADAREMCRLTADALGISESEVAVASTGVIAQPLPMYALRDGIPKAASALAKNGWEDAADAIRTTDLVSKWHTAEGAIGGTPVTVTGIAKGSGMIHPDMATMLCFIATDAAVSASALQAMLARAVEFTFNRITVDGDTSTNDCVLALANGHAEHPEITAEGDDWNALYSLIYAVCERLSRAIVADGEGATKLVDITVTGATDDEAARAICRQVATSNLVKTALFGADPNWGRIIAAAGQAQVPFDIAGASLSIGDVVLVKGGAYEGEAAELVAADVMAGDAYTITLTVGDGPGTATYVTCDLSYDYVKINADYRT
ncbi:MAG: bifunctional glutamate N-acetyltransferase/amino-acid acetyltransferase ArgJ [Leptospirillia bacterium]